MAVGRVQRTHWPLSNICEHLGYFLAQAKKSARWMISHVIARCLNALRIIKKEQLASFMVMISQKNKTMLSS